MRRIDRGTAMRLAHVFVVGAVALAASVALAPEAHAAAAPAAPLTAFTIDGPGSYAGGAASVLDPSNAIFTEQTVDAGMALVAHQQGEVSGTSATMSPPTGSQFVVGQIYQTVAAADATHAGFALVAGGFSCPLLTGSITIRELNRDPDTQAVTAFAVTYSVSCGGGVNSGELRYNSSVGYVAAGVTPGTVDFGVVDLGQTASVQFTITSLGSEPLVLGHASLPAENPGLFYTTVDHCSGRTLTYGQACTVTVAVTSKMTAVRHGS